MKYELKFNVEKYKMLMKIKDPHDAGVLDRTSSLLGQGQYHDGYRNFTGIFPGTQFRLGFPGCPVGSVMTFSQSSSICKIAFNEITYPC